MPSLIGSDDESPQRSDCFRHREKYRCPTDHGEYSFHSGCSHHEKNEKIAGISPVGKQYSSPPWNSSGCTKQESAKTTKRNKGEHIKGQNANRSRGCGKCQDFSDGSKHAKLPTTNENEQLEKVNEDRTAVRNVASGDHQRTHELKRNNTLGCDVGKNIEGKGSNSLRNNPLTGYGGLRYGLACLEWCPPEHKKNTTSIHNGTKEHIHAFMKRSRYGYHWDRPSNMKPDDVLSLNVRVSPSLPSQESTAFSSQPNNTVLKSTCAKQQRPLHDYHCNIEVKLDKTGIVQPAPFPRHESAHAKLPFDDDTPTAPKQSASASGNPSSHQKLDISSSAGFVNSDPFSTPGSTTVWICDVCGIVAFPSFAEARAHEMLCKANATDFVQTSNCSHGVASQQPIPKKLIPGSFEQNMKEKPVPLSQFKRGLYENIDRWDAKYHELCAYKMQHGDCCVPQIFPENPGLGLWVKVQRRSYKLRMAGQQSPMTDNRLSLLEKIGFVWEGPLNRRYSKRWKPKACSSNIQHESWSNRFQQLLEFKEKYGHCIVPQSYPVLGLWVKSQRMYYRIMKEGKKSPLGKEKVKKLEDAGFAWSVSQARKRQGMIEEEK